MVIRTTRPRVAVALLAASVVVAVFAAAARSATIVSQSSWGGVSSEISSGVALAGDGATYQVGDTFSFDLNQRPYLFALKYTADGSLAWERAWRGPEQFNSEHASGVAVAGDGSLYVSGSTIGVGGDALVLKLSPEGSLVWQQKWGASGSDRAEAIAVGSDGSVYVVGSTSSFADATTSGHLFVLKLNPDGTLAWQKIAPGSGQGVAIGPDGSIYAVGVNVRPSGLFEFDTILLKLTPAGELVWQHAYSALDIVDARGGVAVAPDGSVYVAGTGQAVTRAGDAVNDGVLLKFSADGDLLWDRSCDGRDGDTGEGVAVAPDGTVVFTGNSFTGAEKSDDAFVIQVAPNGRGIDGVFWGGSGIDHGDDVEVAPDGTIVVGATAQAPPWTLDRAPDRLSRLRGTVATPTASLVDAAGALSDPAGSLLTVSGGTTFAGGSDAALVRLAP
jgi:uncharacterized delta-60 repeat protein